MQRTDSTTSSTVNLRDSDYNADEALRRVRQIGPRPAPPQQRLTAVPLPREIVADLDILLANPVVPIDADGWAHYGQSDDDSPAIPKIPGPRKGDDHYWPASGFGAIHAHSAFAA